MMVKRAHPSSSGTSIADLTTPTAQLHRAMLHALRRRRPSLTTQLLRHHLLEARLSWRDTAAKRVLQEQQMLVLAHHRSRSPPSWAEERQDRDWASWQEMADQPHQRQT